MKQFKNTVLLVMVLCLGALSLAGCAKQKEKEARKELHNMVENTKLPVKINDGQTLKAITYDHNVLTYVNEVSADTLAGIKSKEFQTATLDNLRKEMSNRKLVKQLVAAKAEVEYVFYNGTDTLTFRFSPDELQ